LPDVLCTDLTAQFAAGASARESGSTAARGDLTSTKPTSSALAFWSSSYFTKPPELLQFYSAINRLWTLQRRVKEWRITIARQLVLGAGDGAGVLAGG
jgi:hypothetical protein